MLGRVGVNPPNGAQQAGLDPTCGLDSPQIECPLHGV